MTGRGRGEETMGRSRHPSASDLTPNDEPSFPYPSAKTRWTPQLRFNYFGSWPGPPTASPRSGGNSNSLESPSHDPDVPI
eukprot:6627783-Pyramimonas_sp.AAC.1